MTHNIPALSVRSKAVLSFQVNTSFSVLWYCSGTNLLFTDYSYSQSLVRQGPQHPFCLARYFIYFLPSPIHLLSIPSVLPVIYLLVFPTLLYPCIFLYGYILYNVLYLLNLSLFLLMSIYCCTIVKVCIYVLPFFQSIPIHAGPLGVASTATWRPTWVS